MAVTSPQFHGLIDALEQVLRFERPADAVMSAFFREHRKLGSRDRKLISETVYAVLRRYCWLCALLEPQENSHRNLAIAALLRLRGHNLREINELLKSSEQTLATELKARKPELSLAQQAELPQWVIDKLDWPESDILALGQALQQAAPLDLRVNSFKGKRKKVLAQFAEEGIAAEETPHSNIGIRLGEKIALQQHPLFQDGQLEVQDEGSQLLGLMVAAKRGEMVVDFCAGAGGKTLLLASAMANRGRVYAVDVSEKRLKNLSPRLKRSGLSNISTILINDEQDARIKRLNGKIDRVLVDAPCSGMGTLRRNPDLKFRQSSQSVSELNAKQSAILESAAHLLKPSGRLVYATCSLLREENEDIVEAFLAKHTDFTLLPVNEALPKLELEMGDYLKLYPHLHQTDGFFAAAMVRNKN